MKAENTDRRLQLARTRLRVSFSFSFLRGVVEDDIRMGSESESKEKEKEYEKEKEKGMRRSLSTARPGVKS